MAVTYRLNATEANAAVLEPEQRRTPPSAVRPPIERTSAGQSSLVGA
jgi:hypothetical protein